MLNYFSQNKKNKLFTFNYLLVFILTFSMFFVIACKKGKESETPSVVYPENTARIISHVTSGVISSEDNIHLRFVDPIIKKDIVGTIIKPEIFKFKPEIKGVSKWQDSRTIVFIPQSRLPFHEEYTGTIIFRSLIEKKKNLNPLNFSFRVAGRELETLNGEFELVNENDPDKLNYRGEVGFTENIDFKTVKKNVVFFSQSGNIPMIWSEKSSGKEFVFTSGTISRKNSGSNFILKIDKKGTEISETIIKKIVLEPLKKFTIADIIKFDKGQKPGLEIRFSQKVQKGQDIKGLISVEPAMEISLKSLGQSVYINGDFKFGAKYSVKIRGIKSKWGNKINNEIVRFVNFEDKKPQIGFSSSGIFLPSSKERKIGFRTLNVKNVKVVVKKVFESNIGQFLQSESLSGRKKRNSNFSYSEMNRVGVEIAQKNLVIGDIKNRWLNHQLDMEELIKKNEKGIFVIELSFARKDMLYSGLKKKTGYYYGNNYYSNPNSYGYMYRHGKVYKPVLVSDIGLTYKTGGGGEHFIFATDIVDSSPMSGVNVTIRDFQNQKLVSGETDGEGKVLFKKVKGKAFYIEAEKGGQKSIVKPSEMGWNLSSFDTGGVINRTNGTRAFIYTERGVYRPGDQINLSIIARNGNGSFPDNHPATLELYNPRNQLTMKKVENKVSDGFYNFLINTSSGDLTGNWRAKLTIGSTHFFHTLKIETVVPFRLKVLLEPEKLKLSSIDDKLKLSIKSKYLFGSPSPFLNTDISVLINHVSKSFKKFEKFIFTNEIRNFKSSKRKLFEGKLDNKGAVEVIWKLPEFTNVPSSLRAEIISKVYEKGGRATTGNIYIPIDPYKTYVGLKRPKLKYGYSKVGSPVKIDSILVTKKGEPVSGRTLRYRVYRNARYWWWEYDNLASFKVSYKKDNYTKVVKEGTLTSKNVPAAITFIPEQSGEYFIEVFEELGEGHKAGFFFSSYYWGESPTNIKDSGALTLRSDKKKYKPGDTAVISFPKPKKGTMLASLEKGDSIIRTWVREFKGEETIGNIKVPITEEMLPNAYISVSIIQPHSQTGNDRPIRVYGTIPLMVEDPSTRRGIEIIVDEKLESNKNFEVTVKTKDKSDIQFTIAIVDEGLLDLTRFKTPDPWMSFFSKQKLGINTYDIFSHVLSANKGDIYRLFSIGGGIMARAVRYEASQLEPGKSKRFKAVSMFRGPLRTDKNGEKKVKFKMPNYIGSVRIMVIAAKGNGFGKTEKSIPVKTDLMILPTLPRILGPGDSFKIPVTVFALNERIRKVKLAIRTEGILKISGRKTHKLIFKKVGEKDAVFDLKVEDAVGNCKVIFKAESGKYKISKTIDINVRPSSPRIYSSIKKDTAPGKMLEFTIPDNGLKGTNRASVVISRKSKLDIENRLSWLIHYPYGCIEQTVSSVFPQLYLKEFIKDSSIDIDNIDENINFALKRLRKFILPSGGLSYWPGNRDASIWGTNYGMHFMIEAKKRGYGIPGGLLKAVIRFQKSRALVSTDPMLSRIYRLYVLALADEPQIGPMNLIIENDLDKTTNVEKWMLSSAYFLAGKRNISENIRQGIKIATSKYKNPGRTFGSSMRDRAIILNSLTLFKDWNKADIVYEGIVRDLSTGKWYSTQTLGYSLLALGKYMLGNKLDFRGDDAPIKGYVIFPDGKKQQFNFISLKNTIPVSNGFGKKIKLFIDKNVKVGKVYVALQWNGIPLKSLGKDISENLKLNVSWINEEGKTIDPTLLKQGTTFWGHFRVKPNIYSSNKLSELALVQLIPAGWEIENIRLSGERKPNWMKKWVIGREKYTDIRDDRIMWFFDMHENNNTLDFVVKLICVTEGRFILPPTIFEAMYDNNYRAVKKGRTIRVTAR